MTVSCTKRRYSRKSYAKAALKRARKVGGQADGCRTPQNLYLCPHCGEWHLTSQARPKDAITSRTSRTVFP